MTSNSNESSTVERRDAYGFILECTREDEAVRDECAQRQNQQVVAWEKYWTRKQLPKPDKLKKLCRKGIPVEMRAWVWLEMSGARQRKADHMAGYYEAMLQKGEISSECARQIDLDLPRTFPQNELMRSGDGQAALGRLLLAFSVHRPDIGYCQGMNCIAAMLLLVLERNEENAFWMLVSLIDNGGILYHDMYTRYLVGTQVEMQSLDELTVKKLPKLHKHLQQLHCDMTMLSTDWFMCLFSTALPSETAMRVWDSLLEEGAKILFRISVALLKLFEPELIALDNPGEIVSLLRQRTHTVHDRDKLMKIAFDGLGSLPMKRISNLREAQQEIVNQRMKERESRDAARRSLSNNQVTNRGEASDSTEDLSVFAEKLGLENAAWSRRNLPHEPASQQDSQLPNQVEVIN